MDKTLAIILAVSFVFTGLPMATGQPSSVEQGRHLRFSPRNYRLLGLVQIVGAVALAIGVFWEPLALAAAAGFSLMMIGAVVTHLRAGDPAAKVFPATLFGLASIATVVLFLV
jgi:uncharacterized membrane protein YphA (DoxX/SURF4 family)